MLDADRTAVSQDQIVAALNAMGEYIAAGYMRKSCA